MYSTKTMTITFTDGQEADVEVEYEYHRSYRGHRNSLGVPEEPNEPAEVEINSVLLGDLEISEWKEVDLNKIAERIMESIG